MCWPATWLVTSYMTYTVWHLSPILQTSSKAARPWTWDQCVVQWACLLPKLTLQVPNYILLGDKANVCEQIVHGLSRQCRGLDWTCDLQLQVRRLNHCATEQHHMMDLSYTANTYIWCKWGQWGLCLPITQQPPQQNKGGEACQKKQPVTRYLQFEALLLPRVPQCVVLSRKRCNVGFLLAGNDRAGCGWNEKTWRQRENVVQSMCTTAQKHNALCTGRPYSHLMQELLLE